MDYQQLYIKRDRLRDSMKNIPANVLSEIAEDFIIRYTHDSTAMEGNTLSLAETKLLIQGGISADMIAALENEQLDRYLELVGQIQGAEEAELDLDR